KVIGISFFFIDDWTYPKEQIVKTQITKQEYLACIRSILKTENISEFDFLVYSMGARFTLCLLEEYNPSNAFFLAQDGIVRNRSQQFVSSWFGRLLFRQFVQRSKLFFSFVNALKSVKLISKSTVKFLTYYLDIKEKRNMVYNVWLSSKRLVPDNSKLRSNST